MPIARFALPDGRVARFSVPEGTTPEAAQRMMEAQWAAQGAEEEPQQPTQQLVPQSGLLAQVKKGAEQFFSSGVTGIQGLGGDPVQAANEGIARGKKISEAYADEYGLDQLGKVYNERGLFPAMGEVARQVPLAIAGQIPNFAASIVGAKLGAMAGTAVAPGVGTVVGGGLGALAAQLPVHLGEDYIRQQKETPGDINKGAALAAAGAQSTLEAAGPAFMLGRNLLGKLLGPEAAKVLGKGGTEAAEKLAKEGLAAVVAKGTAKGIAAEVPTEVVQQMLERAQAGLALTTPDAWKEYGEAAYQAALTGPLGAAARVADRSSARSTLATDAYDQKQQAAKQARVDAETARVADETRKQSPEYLQDLATRYGAFQTEYRTRQEAITAMKPDKGDPAAVLAKQMAGKELSAFKEENKALIADHAAATPLIAAQRAEKQQADVVAKQEGVKTRLAARAAFAQGTPEYDAATQELKAFVAANRPGAASPEGDLTQQDTLLSQEEQEGVTTKSNVPLSPREKQNKLVELEGQDGAGGFINKLRTQMDAWRNDPAQSKQVERLNDSLFAAIEERDTLRKSLPVVTDPVEEMAALQEEWQKLTDVGNKNPTAKQSARLKEVGSAIRALQEPYEHALARGADALEKRETAAAASPQTEQPLSFDEPAPPAAPTTPDTSKADAEAWIRERPQRAAQEAQEAQEAAQAVAARKRTQELSGMQFSEEDLLPDEQQLLATIFNSREQGVEPTDTLAKLKRLRELRKQKDDGERIPNQEFVEQRRIDGDEDSDTGALAGVRARTAKGVRPLTRGEMEADKAIAQATGNRAEIARIDEEIQNLKDIQEGTNMPKEAGPTVPEGLSEVLARTKKPATAASAVETQEARNDALTTYVVGLVKGAAPEQQKLDAKAVVDTVLRQAAQTSSTRTDVEKRAGQIVERMAQGVREAKGREAGTREERLAARKAGAPNITRLHRQTQEELAQLVRGPAKDITSARGPHKAKDIKTMARRAAAQPGWDEETRAVLERLSEEDVDPKDVPGIAEWLDRDVLTAHKGLETARGQEVKALLKAKAVPQGGQEHLAFDTAEEFQAFLGSGVLQKQQQELTAAQKLVAAAQAQAAPLQKELQGLLAQINNAPRASYAEHEKQVAAAQKQIDDVRKALTPYHKAVVAAQEHLAALQAKRGVVLEQIAANITKFYKEGTLVEILDALETHANLAQEYAETGGLRLDAVQPTSLLEREESRLRKEQPGIKWTAQDTQSVQRQWQDAKFALAGARSVNVEAQKRHLQEIEKSGGVEALRARLLEKIKTQNTQLQETLRRTMYAAPEREAVRFLQRALMLDMQRRDLKARIAAAQQQVKLADKVLSAAQGKIAQEQKKVAKRGKAAKLSDLQGKGVTTVAGLAKETRVAAKETMAITNDLRNVSARAAELRKQLFETLRAIKVQEHWWKPHGAKVARVEDTAAEAAMRLRDALPGEAITYEERRKLQDTVEEYPARIAHHKERAADESLEEGVRAQAKHKAEKLQKTLDLTEGFILADEKTYEDVAARATARLAHLEERIEAKKTAVNEAEAAGNEKLASSRSKDLSRLRQEKGVVSRILRSTGRVPEREQVGTYDVDDDGAFRPEEGVKTYFGKKDVDAARARPPVEAGERLTARRIGPVTRSSSPAPTTLRTGSEESAAGETTARVDRGPKDSGKARPLTPKQAVRAANKDTGLGDVGTDTKSLSEAKERAQEMLDDTQAQSVDAYKAELVAHFKEGKGMTALLEAAQATPAQELHAARIAHLERALKIIDAQTSKAKAKETRAKTARAAFDKKAEDQAGDAAEEATPQDSDAELRERLSTIKGTTRDVGEDSPSLLRGVELDSPDLTATQVAALDDNNLVGALADIANDKGNTDVNKAVATRLAALLDATDVSVPDRVFAPDGKEALGSATSMLVKLSRALGLTQETLLHEGVHAAVQRVLEMPESQLSPLQRTAKRELEMLFAVVQKDPRFTSVNAKTALGEFVAEALSNRNLQAQLKDKPWKLSDAWQGFKSIILRMLGIKDPQNMFDAALQSVDALMIPSSVRTDGTERVRNPLRSVPETAGSVRARVQQKLDVFAAGMQKINIHRRSADAFFDGYEDAIADFWQTRASNALHLLATELRTKKYPEHLVTPLREAARLADTMGAVDFDPSIQLSRESRVKHALAQQLAAREDAEYEAVDRVHAGNPHKLSAAYAVLSKKYRSVLVEEARDAVRNTDSSATDIAENLQKLDVAAARAFLAQPETVYADASPTDRTNAFLADFNGTSTSRKQKGERTFEGVAVGVRAFPGNKSTVVVDFVAGLRETRDGPGDTAVHTLLALADKHDITLLFTHGVTDYKQTHKSAVAIAAWLKKLGFKSTDLGHYRDPPAEKPVYAPAAADTLAGDPFVERMTPAQKKFTDKYNSTFGLGLEMETVDMRAPLLKALSKGAQEAYRQAMYYVRQADARMDHTFSVMSEGALKLIRDSVGNHYFTAGHGPSMIDVFKEIRALPGKNAENKVAQAHAYMTALRGKRVGYNRLESKDPVRVREESEALLAKVEADPALKAKLESFRSVYNAYNKGLIDFAVQSGAISKAEGARLSKHGDYVPFYRADAGGAASLVFGDDMVISLGDLRYQPHLQALRGGEGAILPLNESIMQNTLLLTDIATRNLSTKASAYAMQAMGMGKIVPGKGGEGSDIIRFKQEPDPRVEGDTGDRWIRVKTEGTAAEGIPADMVVKSLEGAHHVLPASVRFMGTFGDVLRKGITRIPLYVVRQLIRDPMSAAISGGLETGMLSSVGKAIAEFTRQMRGTSKTSEALLHGGVVQSGVFTGDPDDLAKFALQLSVGDQGAIAKAMAFLDRAAMRADASTRALMYEQVLKRTGSEMEALLAAREMMNFNKRGLTPTVQHASRMIPFLNTQIQGLNVLYKSMRGQMPHEEAMQIKAKFQQRAALLVATTLVYALAMEDDESYKNASPRERYSNFFLPIPGRKESLRIPIPFEAGLLFKALPEAMLDVMRGKFGKQEWEAIRGLFINSIPGASNYMVVPQMGKPALEVMSNKNWFTGRDIETDAQRRLLPQERYSAATSEVAKRLSEVAHGVLSPVQIEHLARGYLGSAPIAIAALTNELFRGANDVPRPDGKLSQTPFFSGAFQDSQGMGAVEAYYAKTKAIDEVQNTFDKMVKEGRTSDAKALVERSLDVLSASKLTDNFQKRFAELAKREKLIRASPLPGEEKRRLLDALDKARNVNANLFLQAVKAVAV